VHGDNAGNVFLNPDSLHQEEFGGALMYWNLRHNHVQKVTGSHGDLARRQAARSERRYRVLAFMGCRTDDYLQALTGTPGFDQRAADVFSTDDVSTGNGFAAFLDGILHMDSAERIAARVTPGIAYTSATHVRARGLRDNPVVG
jgi:hypothetical protein